MDKGSLSAIHRSLFTSEGEGPKKPVCLCATAAGLRWFGTSALCCCRHLKPLRRYKRNNESEWQIIPKARFLHTSKQITKQYNNLQVMSTKRHLFEPFFLFFLLTFFSVKPSLSETTNNSSSLTFFKHTVTQTYQLPPWKDDWDGRWGEAPWGSWESPWGGQWWRGYHPPCWAREQFCPGETFLSAP